MRSIVALLAAVLIFLPHFASARSGTVACGLAHYTRNGGNEVRVYSIALRNLNATESIQIDRITILNAFGDVVRDWDNGSIPPNPDYCATPDCSETPLPRGADISSIPPGASYYFSTEHIWDFEPLPLSDGGYGAGLAMTALIDFSVTAGAIELSATAVGRSRERLNGAPGRYVMGTELARSSEPCTLLSAGRGRLRL